MIVEIFRNIVQANKNVLGCNIYIGVQFHGMVDIAFIYDRTSEWMIQKNLEGILKNSVST